MNYREQRKLAVWISCLLLATAMSIRLVWNTGPAVSVAGDGGSSWGLSFQNEGQAPVGNATADYLKEYNAYFIDQSGEKKIYLTFDAGYENGYTASILDTLKQHGVSATFFLVGNYISSAPELVQRMARDGHTVGNHTFSHPDMSAIADQQSFRQELTALEELYRQTTGQSMAPYYRPPQGRYSESNLRMAADLGYTTFFWSLAYVDWYTDQQPSQQEALSKLNGRIHPGAIVLLHSTSQTNAEILDTLLTGWEQQGYTFGTLADFISA